MRKLIFFNCLIAAGFVIGLAFMSGCEGPQGPAGADGSDGADGTSGTDGTDGTDGVDGNVTCLQCHSAETPQIILEQFQQSTHSAGEIVERYGGVKSWGDCARCHSSEGFIEYARTGDLDGKDIKGPSSFECKTCHSIHETFEQTDYALRLDDPINFNFDTTATTYDFGNSNLCSNCHNSRTGAPDYTHPGDSFEITNEHYGPHHGTQANVLAGIGLSEVAGSFSYPDPESASHYDLDDGMCTGCHMYTYGNGAGGHTWNPALDGCNTANCHDGGVTDFDHNNVQTENAGLLEDLRDLLEAQGVIHYEAGDYYALNEETGAIELVTAPGGYHPVLGEYTMAQAQAFFNWTGLEDDKSQGVHNPTYVKALLENSIEAITP
jgi:formate-dependent nitrite reductase cytochrome c552 subunit